MDAPAEASRLASNEPPVVLDITRDVCPMTFVRTRLALDRLVPGALLQVRLRGEEPRQNVPRTAESLGHTVLSLSDETDGTSTLLLRKG